MGRAERRAEARARSRGQFVEVCLSGCCAPRPAPVHRAMLTRVTDFGDVVLVCPWCDADVPGNLGPGDSWSCGPCGAVGVLGSVLA